MLAKGCCHALMRQALLLAALLVLGSVAAAAAAPGPRPEAAADAGPRSAQAQATTSVIVPTNSEPILPEECPGIEANGTVCGKTCQLRLCKALAAFYKLSNNLTDPWDNEMGWELTTSTPCERLVAGSPRQAVYCSWYGLTCCTPEKLAQRHCSAVNSIVALELPINNINCSLDHPQLLPSMTTLHDCGMRIMNLEANNMIGALSDGWGALDKLIVFNIGNSWLSGTIPDGLRRLRKVKLINLANNWLNGTLPAWIADLTELRVLNLGSNQGGNEGRNVTSPGGDDEEEMLGLLGSIPKGFSRLTKLRELNLEANSLTGELPQDLCQGDNSSLLLLNVRGNKLDGNAQGVRNCGNLVQLDISQNRFSGPLPASTDWDELATYRAASNRFSGRFPMNLTAARILEHLDISGNQLTGIIPPQIVLLSSLKTFVVSSNKFSGTVNENIYYLPALAKLDLSNNTLVGTTPQAIGLAYGLQELDFSNNPGLTGMLPPQMGLLSRLKQVRTSGTNLSCAGIISPYQVTTNNSCADPDRCTTPVKVGDNATRYHLCDRNQLLPCFLRFSEYMVPRDDDSNMRCKYIIRRPVEDARGVCADDDGSTTLGAQAAQLPELGSDRLGQIWHVDPSYFQFQVCECLLGYKGDWGDNGTLLTCHPASHQAPTAIIVGVVAAAAVLIIALLAWWQYLTTRPRWLRERILQAKRSRGAPKASKPGDKVTVSIVVTDVKDFSDLTRQYPELMNKAMGIHNNILRKASHNHAGYIMDQEGDSWTVAFHDAEDAVAFSLQVQQALAQRSWGKLRVGTTHELSDLTGMRDGVFSARFSHTHQSSLHSVPVRHSSSSFGFMGEDAYSTHGQLAATALAMDSFTGGQVDSVHSKINTSFTSSAGRASSVERSFTMPRHAPSEDGTPNQSGPLPPGSLPNGFAGAANGESALANSTAGPAGASTAAADGKHGSGSAHHHPDQRQVSFSDAVPGRDASPFSGPRAQHPQQQQLLRLLRCNSDEQMVQASGNSSTSWPDDAAAISPGNGAMKGSFDSFAQPVPENRLNSLSITAASRGRSSSSGSRLWSAGAAVIRRMSVFGRSGLLSSTTHAAPDTAPQHALHLSVRIGIATGRLPYGCDLNNCAVKDRAKNYVSDVANGGQILLDDNTFKAIKDSLSVLGTVNEAGYDDRQLQQLLHTRVVSRLQHHILCGTCACSGCKVGQREASFSSAMQTRDIQDYDNDALVVHMGAFEPPVERQPIQHSKRAAAADGTSDSSPPSTPSADDAEAHDKQQQYSKDVEVGGNGLVDATDVLRVKSGLRAVSSRKAKVLHLYAIAAPGMRRVPTTTRDITQCLSWGAPVELKRHWSKVQKGYFDAPGARSIDLAPSAQGGDQAALPEVVIVFVQVLGGSSFSYKRNRGETHALKKAITRCMLQMLDELPETDDGRDGYLCRCQEADLKYMVSFKAAHMALQWCMLVQEALMYFSWPESILSHPGFEEVLDPITGLPLFRGPRLRMGFAVGQPNSVLPDHTGRANYYGHSVNRAARFMEAAAHGGQIVTDVDTARQLFRVWSRGSCTVVQDGASTPSRTYSDADVQPMLGDMRQELSQDSVLLQALVARSQSETTGHCRPSAARMPLSRLALRQQQQSSWIQQTQQMQMAGRDVRPQHQLSLPLHTFSNGNKEPASSLLPDSQPLPQLPASPLSFSARQQQQQALQNGAEPSQGSFTRRHISGAEPSQGSFSRRQNAAGGSSLTRPQVAASGGSFTRMQVAPSGGSFSRRQQQQFAAGPQGALPYPQGTSMSASFSARRNAAGVNGNQPQQPLPEQQQQLYGMQASNVSFTMQVPANWQNTQSGEVLEGASVMHLGTFSFKGSGVYDMVHILPAALVGRKFPEEAPKGKGYRVMVAEGPVAGIEPVLFCVPPRLAAARAAFLARNARKAGSVSGDEGAAAQQQQQQQGTRQGFVARKSKAEFGGDV